MKGFVRVMAFAAMTAGSASMMQAQAAPSAADIVARYVTAIGGRDNILKIKSITVHQTVEVPAMGLTAHSEAYSAAPSKNASKTTIAGLGEIITGFDGTNGWEINPMQGPRVFTAKEIEQAKENDLHGSRLFTAEFYPKMEVLGEVDFAGEKAYKVKMTRKSGNEVTNYFSKANGLLIGAETTTEGSMGTSSATMKFSNYQEHEGVKYPARVETMSGPQQLVFTVKSVTFNTVPANAFEAPAVIKPLIGK